MKGAGREGQVLDAVVALVDSLLDDFDVVELLSDLTEQCALLLDVSSAGLLLADAHGLLRLMAATSEQSRDLELFQLQSDEGPCLDCYATGQPVSVADLRTVAERWPRFVEAATGAGFGSVHAVPLRAAKTVVGTLGLFGATPGELSAADLAVGQTLAHVATVAILQEHAPVPASVLPHLRHALTSRVVVEQAKGFLHERLGVSIHEAFGLLRRYASEQHLHLTDVARTIMSDPAARPEILVRMAEPRAAN
jgi:transcriptional regulator with GAF, ATPase, and Fis domain